MTSVANTAPEATIVIATLNRRGELRRALESALRQNGSPEILVIDDGSTDGTCEMVASDFPSVRLFRSEASLGYCVQRNRGTALANGRIVIGLDDDAFFKSNGVVTKTISDFNDERIAVVAIPFSENRSVGAWDENEPPDRYGVWVASTFVAAAYAARRDYWLACGGLRESLFGRGEEGELSLRMLSAGLVIRRGTAAGVEHHESPKRNRAANQRREARNEILIGWYLAPNRYLPFRWLKVIVNHLVLGFQRGLPKASVVGLIEGLRAAAGQRNERTPVSTGTYRLFRRLRKARTLELKYVAAELEPLMPAKALTRTASQQVRRRP